jgi:leucyl-tRNA synthetase
LSDSVIYMAYYSIVRAIKEHRIQPERLTDEVFDYIFLGLGKPDSLARKVGLSEEILEEMRKQFTYFYPLDSRHSGRDLVPNHLTFMVFNHTAIFPEKLWPRQIVTNGSVLMQGAKMSKSFGNIIPLVDGIAKFGADPLRLGILATAELLQDADFSPTMARSMRDRLEQVYRRGEAIAEAKAERISEKSLISVDKWMLSRLQSRIRAATEAMDKLAVRKAIHSALYELDKDVEWYRRRIRVEGEQIQRKQIVDSIFREVLDAQIRMLAPVTPHVCEELWEKLGHKGFVSLAAWPTPNVDRINVEAEENEALIESVLEDTLNIIKATGTEPKKVHYYVAAPWKWRAYLNVLKKSMSEKIVQGDLMKELMTDEEMRKIATQLAKFVGQIIAEVKQISTESKQRQMQVGETDEKKTLTQAQDFLGRELKTEVRVYNEEDSARYDPKNRSSLAKPNRPAIYIE